MSRRNINVTTMRWPHRHLSPRLRLMATTTLVFYLAAMTFCALAQSGSSRSAAPTKMMCAGIDRCAGHCKHGSSSSSPFKPICPPGSNACDVLKTALPGPSAAELIPPSLPVLSTLPFFALALDVKLDQLTASIFRQVRQRDWVFTPEVCLGPAFRSHAPPSLA